MTRVRGTALPVIERTPSRLPSAIREWRWKGYDNPAVGIKLGKSESRFVRVSSEEEQRLVQALTPLQLFVFRQPEDTLDCGLEPDDRPAVAPRGGKAPLLDQAFQRALATAQSGSDLCLR